jgi:inhibitor of KinA sporulation pathway (predicted exonuclease)
MASEAAKRKMPYTHLIVLDFEATCFDKGSGREREHEIIEFPSVVIDIAKGEIVDKIEQFVKPSGDPKLSTFCKNLTTITQAQVDGGVSFEEAFKAHAVFCARYPNFAITTCGDWDLKTMLPMDAKRHGCSIPGFYRRWVNLKIPFMAMYGLKRPSMTDMLDHLKIELSGTHHRGIDDSINISKIAIRMLADGWVPEITGRY